MIISGKNSVLEVLNSNKTINKVMICNKVNDDFSKMVVKKCKEKKIRFDFVDRTILDKLSNHNQGFVADVIDFEYSDIYEIINSESKENSLVLILDGVEDPHNLGSIVRVADCVKANGIVIENRRSCPVNETVYKTSGGAISYVKIARVNNINDEIKKMQEKGYWVYACEAGGESVYKTNLTGKIAIVMGSEGKGVGALTKKICDGIISLPMLGNVNSLNVSTATCAIAYEIIRQRINSQWQKAIFY